MNLNHINVIARYEVKLVKRSWLFRIFAILALLFISAIMLGYQTGIVNRMDNLWPRIAVSSLMPFCNTYFYNIAHRRISGRQLPEKRQKTRYRRSHLCPADE